MKKATWFISFVFILFFGAAAAWAPCGLSGYVFCDVNGDGVISEGDTPLSGVGILLDGESPGIYTDATGYYYVLDHYICGVETVSLDLLTLPDDVIFVDPAENGVAYISAGENPIPQEWLIDSAVCHPTEPEPAIDIRKQAEGPDSRTFLYGSDVTFEIEVVNTGNVALTDVVVTDAMAPSCDYSVGDLAVGESFTYECTVPYVTAGFENVACVSGIAEDVEVTDCDPSTVVIEGGGQGCTPGYWKQDHHFGSWTAPYTPDTLFSDVFEDAFPGKTLVEVLAQGGGQEFALGRHTVAALLNAASPGVSYDLPVDSVIDMFNSAYPDGDYEALKDYFENFNEQGCPLNNDQDKIEGKDKDEDKKKKKNKNKKNKRNKKKKNKK